MKKEKKLEKTNSKEGRKNKIQKLIKMLNFGEIFLIAIPLVRLGMIIIMAILTILSGDAVEINQINQELFGTSEIIFATFADKVFYTIAIILSCIGYVINILMINNIKKILINLEEDKTPFSEKNLALLDKIKGFVLYSFITVFLGNEFGMNLVAVIVVLALIAVFKHGIVLQQEVDETL